MKITVLGSSSGFTVTHRNQSAYLVETGQQTYLIDAGEGVSPQLVKYKIEYNRIETVFITHKHPDHVSGLFRLLQMMHLTGRNNPLNIYLPHDVVEGVENNLPYFQIIKDKWSFDFQFNPITKGQVYKSKDLDLYAIPNNHLKGNESYTKKYGMTSDSYSFLLTNSNGKNVLYTSDVDSLSHLVSCEKQLNDNVAILISEFAHISMKEILDFAKTKKIPRVVITHITPENENKKNPVDTEQSLKIDWAVDGYVIEV